MENRSTWNAALSMGAAYALWVLTLVVAYAVLSLGCAWGWASLSLGVMSFQRALLLGIVLTSLIVSWLLLRLFRRRNTFVKDDGPQSFAMHVAYLGALSGVPIIVVTFSGVAMLSLCD